MADDDLRTREAVRRKALWTLSHLMPGDPKAAAILDDALTHRTEPLLL